MEKLQNLKKKASALLLAVTMTLTMLPQLSTPVHAAELPDNTQFAIKDELMLFNTNNNDGNKNPAKVYFGNNAQQWWIAGSQTMNSLTLFATSPLATDQLFEPAWDINKTYSETWECDYASDPDEVYPNHYGASPLRDTLKELESSYFTTLEQNLMKDTTIYTNDTKNNTVYSTTDKLYLAYGTDSDSKLTVGTNIPNALNTGLFIDSEYWGNSVAFWIRTPFINNSFSGLVADPHNSVTFGQISESYMLVPAFELNLSSVIFASAAQAASSEGNLALQDTDGQGAFTLRYKTDKLGSALVSYDKSKVELKGVPNGTYLVVQNSNGAWTKQITNETEVSARDMSLDSFANCKVWLETTDTTNRMTYATLATEEQRFDVNITAGNNLTVTNGTQGVVQGSAIRDITVEVVDKYYLPEGYIDGIKGLNGLTATATDTGFKISGTPTADVNITLTEATPMPQAPTPNFTENDIKRTKSSLTVNGTFDVVTYGDIEYQWDSGTWGTSPVLSDLEAGSKHTVSVRYQGKGIYLQSAEITATVSTKKDGKDVIDEPTNLTGIYGQTLKDVTLLTGWTWENKGTPLLVGTKSFKAHFDTKELETDYDFTGITGYNAQKQYVERKLSVEVSKADTLVEMKVNNIDKVYDGQEMAKPEIEVTGSSKTPDFKWYQKEADGSYTELKSAPKVVGSYKVVVSVEADDNYSATSTEKEFVISKANNEWTENLSIADWAYGNNANNPTASAKFGTVEFTYSNKENGTYTSDVPSNAGIWYVKASIAGTENYTGLEAKTSFEIAKIDSQVTITTKNMDKVYDGQEMAKPEIKVTGSSKTPDFKWYQKEADGTYTKLKSAPKVVGSYKVVISVEADDNCNTASTEKEFVISKADNEWKENLSITDWIYGNNANNPTASAKFGTVEFTYSNEKNGTYNDKVPTNAGIYYVKASVASNVNYTGLTQTVVFEITKAVPVYDVPQGLMMKQNETLSTVKLPEGFAWVDDTKVLDESGKHTLKAIFTPEDTNNYQSVEVDIIVEVVAPIIPLNSIPTIQAKDKTVTVGDKFDPLKDVSAFDKEDGNLTKDIKVIKNTVDMTKAGTYKIIYQVVDSQKATATKAITVTVKEKAGSQDTVNKPEKGDNEQIIIETGDATNIFLWNMTAVLSVLGIIIITSRKRKMRKN
ncbi:MAG: MBG domain-containing protein [Longibaculum muris]|uniref:Uncharacterized protein DUF5011 n=1 Tax=Longibaculum muris TaxID=1796628 RepID=A0A4R3Z583_9FIRM|nr:MBG domain-containing protein [Longibaculum muris]MCR1886555.1 DUF5011 domain-containing protein [Longibaculum muris]MED9813030.1 MBG domain-containing protein [Longibaculum muris]TCW01608.1 uncharacterized protein DUF5011 [Longibaculum muris]